MHAITSPFEQARYRNAKVTCLNFAQCKCNGPCKLRKSVGQFTKDPEKQLCNVCFARKPKTA